MTENLKNKATANIDDAEIAKFEAMAPIWWDKKGVQKPLHDINVLRVNYINTRAPLSGKKVLDEIPSKGEADEQIEDIQERCKRGIPGLRQEIQPAQGRE